MITIYKLEGDDPKLVKQGYFSNGIVHIYGNEMKITEEEALIRFNRGYWRM